MYGLQVHALCMVDGLWKAVLIMSVKQCCMTADTLQDLRSV